MYFAKILFSCPQLGWRKQESTRFLNPRISVQVCGQQTFLLSSIPSLEASEISYHLVLSPVHYQTQQEDEMLRCSSVITALTRGKTITKLKTPAAACCGAEWRLHLSLDGRKSSSTLEKQSENRPELFPLLSPLWTDLGSLVFLLCGSCKMHRISDFTTD